MRAPFFRRNRDSGGAGLVGAGLSQRVSGEIVFGQIVIPYYINGLNYICNYIRVTYIITQCFSLDTP
jgi:hypothetical protein